MQGLFDEFGQYLLSVDRFELSAGVGGIFRARPVTRESGSDTENLSGQPACAKMTSVLRRSKTWK